MSGQNTACCKIFSKLLETTTSKLAVTWTKIDSKKDWKLFHHYHGLSHECYFNRRDWFGFLQRFHLPKEWHLIIVGFSVNVNTASSTSTTTTPHTIASAEGGAWPPLHDACDNRSGPRSNEHWDHRKYFLISTTQHSKEQLFRDRFPFLFYLNFL